MDEFWQLWCLYERDMIWRMEGFFRSDSSAERKVGELQRDASVPFMSDYAIVKVQGRW